MTTQTERDYYTGLTKEIIKEAAGKNKFAYDYLWKLMCISRTVDDIYDMDQEITRSQLLEAIDYLLVELPYNPFFIKYRDTLTSQHVSMHNAWLSSNLWNKGDETSKVYAHVWRDYHHEVVPLVALLTQGPKKMREVSFKVRQMFKKKLGE
jgi:hypothetical protein